MQVVLNSHRSSELRVGAAAVDVSPRRPTFLYGYPHVPRLSTGVHDPLLASAIYLDDGQQAVLFVNVDVIWLSKQFVVAVRERIGLATGLAPRQVVITATHTHSGPVTLAMVSNADDPVVTPPEAGYLAQLMDGVVTAATEAHRRAESAEMAIVTTRCASIGGNRHDCQGATIDEIPVVAARAANDPRRWLAVMYVNRVHPTVLHEDSTLVSGDFPGLCRRYLQAEVLGDECPVLCHLGAAGDQSPRYVARANDYTEATRLGELLGREIATALTSAKFHCDWPIAVLSSTTDLPMRNIPTLPESTALLHSLRQQLEHLQTSGAKKEQIRTAQCAVFGGEETICLARAADTGRLRSAANACLPAEIQVIRLGQYSFVAWPGEVFAEFALRVRDFDPNVYVITLANGDLQGYLVTEEAVRQNYYEASNAVFSSPESGTALVNETLALLAQNGNGLAERLAMPKSSVTS